MKSAVTTVLTLASVAMSAQAFNFNLQGIYYPQSVGQNKNGTVPANSTSADEVRYFSGLARGFIQGYRRGMYKENNYRVAKECFDAPTQKAMVSILDTWNGYTIDWSGEMLNLLITFKNVNDWCEYDESLYDYMSYCFDNGDMCNPELMMGTLLKKVFQVTTVANDIAQLMAEPKPQKTDKISYIEGYGERVGSNFGKLLRYATEFDPSMYNAYTDEI